MNFQRLSLACFSLSMLLLAACSTPGTRVVLLPQADGRPSAVVVTTRSGEQTLNKPFQRATALAGATGGPVVDQADPAKVRADNQPLFDLAPPPAQSFTVFFDAGGVRLTSDSQQTMRDAVAAAIARSGGDIVIRGHTDTVGPAAQNDELSRRRAQQVRQMFVEQGQFPASRIEAVGRGERELAVKTADETNEPRNRRVVIEVR